MEKTAVIVVDMLNDFVTGALGCDRARALVPALERLIRAARDKGVPVIYTNDSHRKGIDHELTLWGDHALEGTKGAEVVPELAPAEGDFVVPKRRYSGFFQTDLHLLLRELGVEKLIMTGLHAHMCVRHTSADAYCWGYEVIAATDGMDAFTQEDYESGLNYLKDVYGARLSTIDELIAEF